ncbi:unnamed protein product [Caenorhabditis angaria]|uniref:Uncharacterized protein n=1 Tax=Caenorhabditis angaria TaxID=860376 RepID=A0A9P1IJI8_9PELO|nr:unnamed protein product [Caenorhabditis angaria]
MRLTCLLIISAIFLAEIRAEGVDADLRQKTDEQDADSSTEKETFSGSVDEYCNKFEKHYSYYCTGSESTDTTNNMSKDFCPSYKKVCATKKEVTQSLTSWPENPFEKRITTVGNSAEIVGSSRKSGGRSRKFREDRDSEEDESVYYEELRRRYPCKPDCDQRIFPHCTTKCKCDYIYPVVQRFCNPPPMPLFLNTCRLWYHGCPQYERYHYASQFIYSKANKGKVLPGAPDQSNPYNIPAPMPLGRHKNRAMALAPILRRQKRDAEAPEAEKLELIIPPPVPEAFLRRAEEKQLESPRKSRRVRKSRRSSSHRRRRLRRHRNNYYSTPTTPRPLTPRELWRALKKINGITSGPDAIGVKSSPATLKGQTEKGGLDGFLESLGENQQNPNTATWQGVAADPRTFTKELVENLKPEEKTTEMKTRIISPGLRTATVAQEPSEQKSTGKARTHQVPILPADSEFAQFAANSPNDFNALSDSRGLVHQVRSRSPFTKPGLWEPNPADPHSRDPPNKYWYHPESVGVDWLNGQLQWGGHWAVPAAGVGGTAGMSAVHFPTIGSFLNIPDDYD